MKRFKLLWLLPVILLVLVGGFVFWAETPSVATAEAVNALQNSADVTVQRENGWYVFTPTAAQPQTGFIFYPGGRVDARAYALALREISARGYLVVLVPMPLNLAVFDPAAARDVLAAFPQIQHWVVGGHSLGGSMAANFAAAKPQKVQGLVFWASYPASSDDLSKSSIQVISIYGSEDGLATGEKIAASKALLPADTIWVKIEGGNHAQFGSYGVQPGDNPASINPAEQRTQVVEATSNFLAGIK